MRGPGEDITQDTGPRGYVEPTFGQRLVARLIDGFVLVPPLALLSLVLGDRLLTAVSVLGIAVYEIEMVARTGRTLGKRAMGTRVVDMHLGCDPTRRQAVLRWLALGGGALTVLVVPTTEWIGPLWVLVAAAPIMQPPLHRGLHDLAAGTIVTADSHPVTG